MRRGLLDAVDIAVDIAVEVAPGVDDEVGPAAVHEVAAVPGPKGR